MSRTSKACLCLRRHAASSLNNENPDSNESEHLLKQGFELRVFFVVQGYDPEKIRGPYGLKQLD